LRAKIARGRSCASVLVIPWRKMTLVRAFHVRAAMAEVGALWEAAMGARPRGRVGEGEWEGAGGVVPGRR
jgi:hypothetical protein